MQSICMSWCRYDGQTDNRPITSARRSHYVGCLRIIPHVVRHLAGVQSDQPISEYLESRKRPVCDSALEQQSGLVVEGKIDARTTFLSKFTQWMHHIGFFVSGRQVVASIAPKPSFLRRSPNHTIFFSSVSHVPVNAIHTNSFVQLR